MFSTTEIADMIFKGDESIHAPDATQDLQVFNLLMALDGKRTVRAIAEQDSYDFDFLCEKINQLHARQLVVVLGDSKKPIPKREVDAILSVLSAFVGPIAGDLLKECATRMGHQVHQIPKVQTHVLIDRIGEFIQPRAKAAEFKKQVEGKLDANS